MADKVGLKGKRETIMEFLRVPISDANREDHQYLLNLTQPKEEEKSLLNHTPYSQADLLFLQCDLLQRFAASEDRPKVKIEKTPEELLKKRLEKEKRKLGHKLFVQDLLLIEEELKELKTVD